ncbi:hypothetical protein WJX81_005385 [Elliptochloris bilobata]|uniref:Uncharacterized protein n=1 Tax=Elliptochloris bilobata TaxID=381761 RepID=A0AAW1RBM8_9CHLO
MGDQVVPKFALALLLLVLTVLSLVYMEDVTGSLRHVIGSPASLANRQSRGTISGLVQPASSVRCNRITLPPQYYNESTGPYNPAAVRHPTSGEWYLFHTYDESWFGVSEYARTGTYLMGRMRSHPLLLKLGKGEAPELRQSNYEDPLMLELDSGFREVQLQDGAELYKAADWRPFVWKGAVYLGHWIGFRPAQERMAIAVLDEDARLVRFVHRFSHLPAAIEAAQYPSGMAPAAKAESASAERGVDFKREKNWGFVAEGDRLLIFYALLPCTVVLEFDAAALDGVRLADRACFAGSAAATLERTGLDILRHPIHGSGNPVPWDIERGGGHRELLSMLHVKVGDYAHWAVRIDRETRRVTHVSAGPVIKARDFRNEGFLSAALVVSSFHVLDKLGGEDGPERMVRILYGEGDRYGCWIDIPAPAIVWHALDPPDGTPDGAPAASAAPAVSNPTLPHAPAAAVLAATAANALAAAKAAAAAEAAQGQVAEGAGEMDEAGWGGAGAPEAGLPAEVAAQLAGGEAGAHSLAEQVHQKEAAEAEERAERASQAAV